MFWVDSMIAILIAFVFSVFLVSVVRWRKPGTGGIWSTLLFLFTFLFLVIWAGGIWLVPFGPRIFNIYWLPFIVSAITFSLIIITLIPPKAGRRPAIKLVKTDEKHKIESSNSELVLGIFFWFLIFALLAVIILRYTMFR